MSAHPARCVGPHSVGHARQHLDLITHAAGVNALAAHLHARAPGDPPAAVAA